MKEQFQNSQENITETRNRVLDQIRFQAVKEGGLTEEMIDRQFAAYNYTDTALKKELLAAYRTIQHKGESTPEHPSQGFIRASAALGRDRAYTDKLNAAYEIASNLKKLHASEHTEHEAAHSMSLEKQDIESNRAQEQQEKEEKIKKTYMEIPSNYRADFRNHAAEALRSSRQEFKNNQDVFNRDTERITEWQKDAFNNQQQEYQNDIDKATDTLNKARSEFDTYKGIDHPSVEDWKTYSQEERESWDKKVNDIILSFKK